MSKTMSKASWGVVPNMDHAHDLPPTKKSHPHPKPQGGPFGSQAWGFRF